MSGRARGAGAPGEREGSRPEPDPSAASPDPDRADVIAEGVDAVAGADLARGVPATRGRARRVWRQLLGGGSAREVLARIVDGDPLDLRAHVAERLRARAWLVDADRVHLRALARCARAALDYRGRPPFEEWLRDVVDAALEDLLREDAEAEKLEHPPDALDLAAFAELARPLGLDPSRMRAACVAFNGLDAADRRAFFDLVLEGHSIEDVAASAGESVTAVARRARRALETVLHGAEPAGTPRNPEERSDSPPAEEEP